MVEMLSEQLDEYPMSVVQQFVHMLGGQLRPAHPAIGVVVVSPSSAGVMKVPEDRPSPWRFFTAQTEDRDMIEFVPIEAEVDIRPAVVDSVTRLWMVNCVWLGALWKTGQGNFLESRPRNIQTLCGRIC